MTQNKRFSTLAVRCSVQYPEKRGLGACFDFGELRRRQVARVDLLPNDDILLQGHKCVVTAACLSQMGSCITLGRRLSCAMELHAALHKRRSAGSKATRSCVCTRRSLTCMCTTCAAWLLQPAHDKHSCSTASSAQFLLLTCFKDTLSRYD